MTGKHLGRLYGVDQNAQTSRSARLAPRRRRDGWLTALASPVHTFGGGPDWLHPARQVPYRVPAIPSSGRSVDDSLVQATSAALDVFRKLG
jgi:hypothetical protein